jgi:predicted RNA-binding Zn ribbon-like protein
MKGYGLGAMSGIAEAARTPLFLAGHLALDFINTAMSPQGTEIELIGDGRAFLAWLVSAGVLDDVAAARLKRQLGAAALEELASDARKLRVWATAWLARWRSDPDGDYEPELQRLNHLLERTATYPQLVQSGGRFELVEQRRGETAGELLAEIGRNFAELVVNEQPALIKRCDGAQCTLWFLDRTKAHRRRFCSVAACGNREKVAAFRARQRRSSKPARQGRSKPAPDR